MFSNQQPSKPFGGQATPFAQQQQQNDPFGSMSAQPAAFGSNVPQSSLPAQQQPFGGANDPFGATPSSVPFDAFGQSALSVPLGNSQASNGGFDFFASSDASSAAKPSAQSLDFNAFAASSVPAANPGWSISLVFK